MRLSEKDSLTQYDRRHCRSQPLLAMLVATHHSPSGWINLFAHRIEQEFFQTGRPDEPAFDRIGIKHMLDETQEALAADCLLSAADDK